MRKLLAVVAIAAPMIVMLPAAPATADSETCVPITADGQPIFCANTQPVSDALAQANELAQQELATAQAAVATLESTAMSIEAQTLGGLSSLATAMTTCRRVEPQSTGYAIYLA